MLIISLTINLEPKEVLLSLLFIIKNLDLPNLCKDKICKKTKTIKTNGKIKCRVKKNLSVCSPTQKPLQIQTTILLPIKGITLIKFVITVAPHNDIWPQGNT